MDDPSPNPSLGDDSPEDTVAELVSTSGLDDAMSTQVCGCACGRSGSAGSAPVYALGRVRLLPLRRDVEAETQQLLGVPWQSLIEGGEDRIRQHLPDVRYLLPFIPFALETHEGMAFRIKARSTSDVVELWLAAHSQRDPTDVDLVVGDLHVGCSSCESEPHVELVKLWSFQITDITNGSDARQGAFDLVFKSFGNKGVEARDRAINYLVTRSEQFYDEVDRQSGAGRSIGDVALIHTLRGDRQIVMAVFRFGNPSGESRDPIGFPVDVTGTFPFLTDDPSSYVEISTVPGTRS